MREQKQPWPDDDSDASRIGHRKTGFAIAAAWIERNLPAATTQAQPIDKSAAVFCGIGILP